MLACKYYCCISPICACRSTVSTLNNSVVFILKLVLHAFQEGYQGTKLTFLARSHLAPKFSKVVAKAKKLGAMKKKKIVEKMHYTVMSNVWHIIPSPDGPPP